MSATLYPVPNTSTNSRRSNIQEGQAVESQWLIHLSLSILVRGDPTHSGGLSDMTDYAHESRTLLQDIEYWAAERPSEPWLVEHWSSHQREISWAEGAAAVRAAAAWLADRAPEPGTRIALLAPNCAHWMLADYATMCSGNVTVPIFTSMDAANVAYAVDFAGVEILILGNAANWEQVRSSFPANIPVVLLPGAPEVEGAAQWDDIVAAGADMAPPPPADDKALATIVFTSGTTGRPKGVKHSLASQREAAGGVGYLAESQPGYRFFPTCPWRTWESGSWWRTMRWSSVAPYISMRARRPSCPTCVTPAPTGCWAYPASGKSCSRRC